jgi:putative transposase
MKDLPTLSQKARQGWGNLTHDLFFYLPILPPFPNRGCPILPAYFAGGWAAPPTYTAGMHIKPVRYQDQRCLHFITFSCYQRMKLLDSSASRETFERELEHVRRWYGCFVTGYVVMPEHVHLLISEPERGRLSLVIQMLKQITSRKLKPPGQRRFWQVRYYDFPVWTEAKRIEKLRYIHRNPVDRRLVLRPEEWKWSSFRHYATGEADILEIESQWISRTREKLGIAPTLTPRRYPR